MPSSNAGLSPLIREGSPVFAAIAAACLLMGGIAGVAGGNEPTGRHEPSVAATAGDADHTHGEADGVASTLASRAASGAQHHAEHHVAEASGDRSSADNTGTAGEHAAAHTHTPTLAASSAGAAADRFAAAGDHHHLGTDAPGGGGNERGTNHGNGGHSGASHGTEHASAGDGHGHATGCDDNHPATRALVKEVQESLATTYKDIAALIALGYHPYFDFLVPGGYPPGGEGISHWLNPNYIDDGIVLDPRRPESVLLDNWNWPIGVMFITDPDVAPPPVYVNDDGTACSPWHPHTDVPARFGWYYYRAVYDRQVEGDFPAQTPEMMHVWAIPNPAGVYAAHNYPPATSRRGAPGPIPSYFSDVTIPGA